MTRATKLPPSPWRLQDRPGFLIRRLHQIHVSLFSQACAAFDITPVQYSLISALALCGRADQTRLAAEVSLDRTTATGALKRLEARGLVERAVSPDDRRARDCRLTMLGADTLRRMEDAARASYRDTIAALTPSEQEVLIGLMKKLVVAHGDILVAPSDA